jgi:rubrerythrin
MSTAEMACKAQLMAERHADFYREAAAKCAGPGKEVFDYLENQSRAFADRIREVAEQIEKGGAPDMCHFDPADISEAKGIVARMVAAAGDAPACATEQGAIAAALGMNKEAVDFYEEWTGRAAEEADRLFADRMAQEHRARHVMLADLHYFYDETQS